MYFLCSQGFEVIARELPRGSSKRLCKVSFLASSCSLVGITYVQSEGGVESGLI